MAVVTKYIQGEHCYSALEDFVQRGELFAAYSNDRKEIIVNWGCAEGYPIGESFARVPTHQVKALIAVLTATIQTK